MHVHVVPNRKSKPTILLRESFRQAGKVKKRTLANLTCLPENAIDAIKAALEGKTLIALENTEVSRIYGVLDVLKQCSDKIGITQSLGSSYLGVLALFLVLARVVHRGSRLSAVRWAQDHCVKEILGISNFDENDLYDALDFLASKQEQIEQELYQQYLKKNKAPPALVLYDVTSSYFEGVCNELACYGYNRDGKKGKKQIVIGLLTDAEGEPLSISVFKGNTADPSTLDSQIEKLVSHFSISDVVLVGDRGMIKAKGKSSCHTVKFSYITALTNPQICKLLKNKEIQLSFFDSTICEVEYEGRRLILRRDDQTYRKEQYRRADKLKRLNELIDKRNAFVLGSRTADPLSGLKKLMQWAAKHKMSSFVKLSLKDNIQLTLEVNESAMKEDPILDGCYVIETDVSKEKMAPEQVHDRYKDLQKVERDFRMMKTGLLEVRPIFLIKANRTKAHIFVSMLALKLSRYVQEKLTTYFGTTNQSNDAINIQDALLSLSRLCLLQYEVKRHDKVHRIVGLPKTDKRLEQILKALDITLTPPKNKKTIAHKALM